ncbi:V-type ATP synthase subunit A [Methanonatronarchaeum sp. AMET6-2]|uniref:V-type ATP synthase subunit A n=1 Tax=Methanonatronarchaeum sp. AMET6-2 TaxID=2933293 RepID=UPI001207672E|nr:V-type ATP synthase subunit A [Methanonatronarchaeum sp. AMET6-2]RZN60546.1 MAG: V-type ATP synthase subunit A [Methanonatronarchaeia archaeon]UOY10464.1 V-type ATP synthase subunit A [Methanonatronarchaeum sp. AMET6-2]
MESSGEEGRIVKVSGPVVVADNMKGTEMYEVVKIGEMGLFGEVIELDGDEAVIQCYEETSGVAPGEKVENTGQPLSVDLAPGLMSSIFDGIQRPLNYIREEGGDFIPRGIEVPSIDFEKKWEFQPSVSEGDEVDELSILGTVPETKIVEHRVMVPRGTEGTVKEIKEGEFTVDETVAVIETPDGDTEEIQMLRKWPVREPRPQEEKLNPDEPLITGQRVLDTFFPMTKGGTAAIPGGFGTGKTVLQHQVSKWADADVIIFIGCGERGNEMAEVLEEFPALEDPETGESLMERTILIANTSNMPVAARESSIYTGITLAEYYRDMGYNVALQADSTSRWAEALREISGRLEEMPGEEGYPAYLATRLAEFYERAGMVRQGDRTGSVSVVGAVSPPGGDFSEPVTQNTLRIVKVFWALSTELKDRRHFPAIDWLESYSLYNEDVKKWWDQEIKDGWLELRKRALELLQQEDELQEVVQLVGPDALPEKERVVLDVSRILREDFLQQNAFHDVDTYCSPRKQMDMLDTILEFYDITSDAVDQGVPADKIAEMEVKQRIARMKEVPEEEFEEEIEDIRTQMKNEVDKLKKEVRR